MSKRHVMRSRVEPQKSFNYFPTHPVFVRALCEEVLHITPEQRLSVYDPACGEGLLLKALGSYFTRLYGSDIHDYGQGYHVGDYLKTQMCFDIPDWVITNPPYGRGNIIEQFIIKALSQAKLGVAMLVPLVWVAGQKNNYALLERLKPTYQVHFHERIGIVKGRVSLKASTATSYVWLVWMQGERAFAPSTATKIIRIKPDAMKRYARVGDSDNYELPPYVFPEKEAV